MHRKQLSVRLRGTETPTPLVKTTVLTGYYATGDHECFCFDRWDGPDAYYERFPAFEDVEARIAAHEANRVYPNDLLPDDAGYFGKWTITVAFEALDNGAERPLASERTE